MLLQLLQDSLALRGLAYGLIGVSFWIGGLIFFHYLWKRLRGEE